MKSSLWFGIIILFTALTMLFVYLIPSNSLFSGLTYIFGFIFVAVVPGYCLVNVLFKDGKLDFIENAVLSVALSFSIAGISGLFLGLSPIGLNTSSITITLSGIVLTLAFLAFLKKREHKLS